MDGEIIPSTYRWLNANNVSFQLKEENWFEIDSWAVNHGLNVDVNIMSYNLPWMILSNPNLKQIKIVEEFRIILSSQIRADTKKLKKKDMTSG